MFTTPLLLSLLFIFSSGNQEDTQEDVEFSSHHTERPIEEAINASIVTADEVEMRAIDANLSYTSNATLATSNENLEANGTGNGTADGKAKPNVEVIKRVQCAERLNPENIVPTVILANSTLLTSVLTVSQDEKPLNKCVVVLFYSPQCVFSARMAPHYNALPRVFPDIYFYAVDVLDTVNFFVRYGLVYIPNVMLFHNAKPFARYNETVLNLDQFVKFIQKFTNIESRGSLNVTSSDMNGPVPSTLVKKVDHLLILAWTFTLACLFLGFSKSALCRRIVDFFRNTWHEANTQHHDHED